MINYLYAPLAKLGSNIAKEVDGVMVKTIGWPAYHELMEEYLKLSKDGKLKFVNEINYGHYMFNGHSGKVCVYELKED
jgi:hypothetical protein